MNSILTQEFCVRHPRQVYRKYCEHCQVPLCDSCSEDNSHTFKSCFFGKGQHTILDIQGAYETKRQQSKLTINTIKSEAFFSGYVLMPGIKADIKTCRTEISHYQPHMLKKSQKMKNIIDSMQIDFMYNVFCTSDIKHRWLEQRRRLLRLILRLQRYIHIYEQSEKSPHQFLLYIKTIHLSCISQIPQHSSQLSMTESLNKEKVMELLSEIQITKRDNRCIENNFLLKLMPVPKIRYSLTLTTVDGCYHISCVTSHRVWVSDGYNLILTHTTGSTLHRVKDLCSDLYNGFHTVNSDSELIYINKDYNINKLSKDMKTTTTFIKRIDFRWRPQCVYWSPFTGDLLVGMCKEEPLTGKVTRYNQFRELTQTIPHENTGQGLYNDPIYVTENNNGDVVVSDSNNAVVVTERGGRHRFSYTGHPSNSGIWPCGICTDTLSHILVCDDLSNTIQMIDKDGQFLSHIVTDSKKMDAPLSLSYDAYTHRLWVGSWDSKLCVYKYMTRQGALTGKAKS
nr:uncharacterized protein LOC117687863 [Crassostrea gigas]XP_034321038.1 uncharacterized protein LOC117687863 [Crassostrea gigas]XP_034321039.1 uncharacterized protein LOC117687863 [Crassostrea gigas]